MFFSFQVAMEKELKKRISAMIKGNYKLFFIILLILIKIHSSTKNIIMLDPLFFILNLKILPNLSYT